MYLSRNTAEESRTQTDEGDDGSGGGFPYEPSKLFCERRSLPLVCGHGGDSTNATPNTEYAFYAALKGEIKCAEVDVAASKDGELFVLHRRELEVLLSQEDLEPAVLRGRPVKVEEFTSKEIASMRFKGGERVLKARDIVNVLRSDERMETIILDVKTHLVEGASGAENVEEMVDLVVRLLEETGCHKDKCIVWAKSDAVIDGVYNRLPQLNLGITVMNETQENRDQGMDQPDRLEKTSSPRNLAVHWETASKPGFVQGAQKNLGKTVFGWTANNDAITKVLLDSAVDGIVTNFPKKVEHQAVLAADKCKNRGGLK